MYVVLHTWQRNVWTIRGFKTVVKPPTQAVKKSPVISLLKEGKLEWALDEFFAGNTRDKYAAASLLSHLGKCVSHSPSLPASLNSAPDIINTCFCVYDECTKQTKPHSVLLAALLDASRKQGSTPSLFWSYGRF